MADIRLGTKIFNGVRSVKMNTTRGDYALFPNYIIGEPVEVILSTANWSGTTYQLKLEGYAIGQYGVQLGLPSGISSIAAQKMIEAALVISETSSTEATTDAAAYVNIRITAIETPTEDMTIALFGLEVA